MIRQEAGVWYIHCINLTNGRDSGLHVLDSERGHCLTNGSDLGLVVDLEVELDRA